MNDAPSPTESSAKTRKIPLLLKLSTPSTASSRQASSSS